MNIIETGKCEECGNIEVLVSSSVDYKEVVCSECGEERRFFFNF